MKDKAIVEILKDYFKKNCPYLGDLAKINVDYLNVDSSDFEQWSIEPMDMPLILSKNVLGTITKRQLQFVLASRMFISNVDSAQNISNLKVFENIANWISSLKRSDLPELNEGETAESLECTSPGFLFGVNEEKKIARYQMTINLTYEKEIN